MFKLADISGFESLGGCVNHYSEISIFNAPAAETAGAVGVVDAGASGGGGAGGSTGGGRQVKCTSRYGLETLFDPASSSGACIYHPKYKTVYIAPKQIDKPALYLEQISPSLWADVKNRVMAGEIKLGNLFNTLKDQRAGGGTGRPTAGGFAGHYGMGGGRQTPTRNMRFIDLGCIED